MNNEKRFNTNAYLTLASKTMVYDEGKGETKEDILEEAMNIITYIYEDIPNEVLEGQDINKIASGYLKGNLDPIIFKYMDKVSTEILPEKNIIIGKLLGSTLPVKKLEISHIEKIKSYQKKKTNK